MKKTILFIAILQSTIIFAQNVGIGTASPVTKLDIVGDIALREGTAIASAATLAVTLSATAPENSFYRVTGTTNSTLNNIANAVDGQIITLVNATTAQTITVSNNNTNATGDIITGTGASIVIPTGASFTLQYSATSNRWYVTSQNRTLDKDFWKTTGNSGTTPSSAAIGSAVTAGSNFLGTTDAKDLVIATSNGTNTLERMRVTSTGNVGIGTLAPSDKFQVLASGGKDVLMGGGANTGSELKLTNSGTTHFSIYNKSDNKLTFANTSSTFVTNTVGTTYMTIDNSGNVAVPVGYLAVGNPTAPTVVNTTSWNAVYWEEFDNYSYWTQSTCRGSNSFYIPFFSGGYIYYEHENNNDDDYAYSPFIFIPANSSASNIRASWSTYVCMETGFDGLRAEISINGNTWKRITNFTSGGYNSNTQSNCGAGPSTNAWSNSSGATYNPVVDLDLEGVRPGDWIQIRLMASTDNSTESCFTDIEVYWFKVEVVNQTNSAAFEAGGVYAAGHIFAHSNSHVGDVAEYFPVKGNPSPGDLIAMNSTEKDVFQISSDAYNPYVIGVYSTDPSVLVNSPEAGIPIGLSGRVPVKVVSKNGKIKIGDYLTASDIAGKGMKADKSCYTFGRALENFDGESGTIMCLIESGWYNPSKAIATSGGHFYAKQHANGLVVNDANMKKDSRVFISFLDEIAGTYWIAKKDNGQFVLNFSMPQKKEVSFDYFIDNAQSGNKIENTAAVASLETDALNASLGKGTEKSMEKAPQKTIQRYQGAMNSKEHEKGKALAPMNESDWKLPIIPPDINIGWIWTPKTGYIQSSHK